MKYIAFFSGGKDSTALIEYIIENNMPLDEVVFADIKFNSQTNALFPEINKHINKFINRLPDDVKFKKISSPNSYVELMKKYDWSDFQNRWCTTLLKEQVIRQYLTKIDEEVIEYVGIAYNERKRVKDNKNKKYPLVEAEMTEKDNLEYCYKKGYDWGGLYNKNKRLSCFFCPLSRLGELKEVYFEYPQLWKQMKKADKISERDFRSDYTLDELEFKFNWEKDNPDKRWLKKYLPNKDD